MPVRRTTGTLLASAALIGTLSTGLTGCVKDEDTIQFQPDQEVVIRVSAPSQRSVFGNSLEYRIENDGPGTIEVVVDDGDKVSTLTPNGRIKSNTEYTGDLQGYPKTIRLRLIKGDKACVEWKATASSGWKIEREG